MFGENNDFTDICSVYTSENGTDMTLNDRKQQIFPKVVNISLYQERCELESYNSTTKMAKCKCSPQIKETLPELSSSKERFSPKKICDNFLCTVKYPNFFALKCYKLANVLKTIWTNYGRILINIILILSLVFLIIFCFWERKK